MYKNPSEIDLEQQPSSIQQLEQNHPFICNICLEIAAEPVITKCGHLYCWPCIYTVQTFFLPKDYSIIQWLNSNQELLSCPVCKNGITTKTLIPLYTKDDAINDQEKQKLKNSEIPPRPLPERINPERNNNQIGQHGNFNSMYSGMNLQHGVMIAGYGYFPSIFNLLFQVGNQIEDYDTESPESHLQKYFKFALLLLMVLLIGTLIFLC